MSLRLTMDQRHELIEIYCSCGKNISKTVNIFSERHCERIPVTWLSVQRLIKKYYSTHSLENQKYPGKPRIVTEGAPALDVLNKVRQNTTSSIRQLARECVISRSSVHRILKRNNLQPYKEKRVQVLKSTDPAQRNDFCTWFLNKVDVWQMLFGDEAIFLLNGTVHQRRIWAVENPHAVSVCKTLHSPKVMVWVGVYCASLIGPYFFEGNVTGK